MGLLLQPVTSDDDFKELIECEWTAYETPYNGFKEIYCPTLGTGPNARQDSMKECRERQLADHKEDSTSHWYKVVDSDSGQIIGGAQWNIYHENPYLNGVGHTEATWWPEGEGRKFASMGMDQWFGPRGKRMNKPHICKCRDLAPFRLSDADSRSASHLLRPSSTPSTWCRFPAAQLGCPEGRRARPRDFHRSSTARDPPLLESWFQRGGRILD